MREQWGRVGIGPLAAAVARVMGATLVVCATAAKSTTTCSAAGSWSGTQATSGTLSVTPASAGSSTYTLSCTGPGGTNASSVVLTAAAAGKSSGGGGGLDAIGLAALGSALLLRSALSLRRRRFAAAPPDLGT